MDAPKPSGSVFKESPTQAPLSGNVNDRAMNQLNNLTASGMNVNVEDYGLPVSFKSGAKAGGDEKKDKALAAMKAYSSGHPAADCAGGPQPAHEEKGDFSNLFGKFGDFVGAIFGGGRKQG